MIYTREISLPVISGHMLIEGDLMYRMVLLFVLLILSGCGIRDERREVSAENTYLQSLDQDIRDVLKDEELFCFNSEIDLIKQMLKRYERGYDTTYFYGIQITDLSKLCDMIAYVSPYDVRLKLQTVSYQKQDAAMDVYEITMEHLDPYYEEARAYAQKTVHEIVTDDMSVHEKVKAIHDFLIAHVTYDQSQLVYRDTASNAFRPYGALLERKAVCSGYARAFMMYARLADIPCLYVSSDTMDHAWNMIYDGTSWLYVDVTWDDAEGRRFDTYLNVPSKEFFADGKHVLDTEKPESFYRRLGNAYFGR